MPSKNFWQIENECNLKISLAQIKSLPGDIDKNISRHLFFVEQAKQHSSQVIFFPELSVTGYEPTLAQKLAVSPSDMGLDKLQLASKAANIIIGVGMPLLVFDDVYIAMVIFYPDGNKTIHTKNFLHPDEEPFFKPGTHYEAIKIEDNNFGLAICYELFLPAHEQKVFAQSNSLYLASVAKHEKGVKNAINRLQSLSFNYKVPAFMVNSIGWADDMLCFGNTMAFNSSGVLLQKLSSDVEGLLTVNLLDNSVQTKVFN